MSQVEFETNTCILYRIDLHRNARISLQSLTTVVPVRFAYIRIVTKNLSVRMRNLLIINLLLYLLQRWCCET